MSRRRGDSPSSSASSRSHVSKGSRGAYTHSKHIEEEDHVYHGRCVLYTSQRHRHVCTCAVRAHSCILRYTDKRLWRAFAQDCVKGNVRSVCPVFLIVLMQAHKKLAAATLGSQIEASQQCLPSYWTKVICDCSTSRTIS